MNLPLDTLTLETAQDEMAQGNLTSHQLVEAYLARVEQLDDDINAVITTNPDALSLAQELDRERHQGHLRGALHGIPVLVKDNIDTGDHMPTTAGSLALETSIAPQDAHVVQMLRNARNLLVCLTNSQLQMQKKKLHDHCRMMRSASLFQSCFFCCYPV